MYKVEETGKGIADGRHVIQRCQLQRRLQSTAATPGASGKERVAQIVEDISRLTLLETADLVSQLKVSTVVV